MKKRIKQAVCSCLCLIMTAVFLPVKAHAASNDEIRVGLSSSLKNVSSVYIKNIGLYLGVDDRGFTEFDEIRSSGGFYVKVQSGYFVDLELSPRDYEDAKSDAEDFRDDGFDAVPVCFSEDEFGVYAFAESKSEAEDIADETDGRVLSSSRSIIEVWAGSSLEAVFDGINPQFEPADKGVIDLSSRKYRGRLEVGIYNGSLLTAVNVISLNDYLYGVLPSEMPQSWHMEALKAQAVAARTYTLTRKGVHSEDGYDLCDGTHCQAYVGFTNESERTCEAVDETDGLAIYYNGELINASYFSSSGGYTDNSENVWTYPLGYLRAVPDIYERESRTWSFTYTADELTALCLAQNTNIGRVTDVKITKQSESGRVQELTIYGTNGNKVLTKETIRTFFSSGQGSLLSRMFTLNGEGNISAPTVIEKESTAVVLGANGVVTSKNVLGLYVSGNNNTDEITETEVYAINGDGKISEIKTGTVTETISGSTQTSSGSYKAGTFTFEGRGYGHGVGLSQYGAKGMAEAGFTFDEILEYYYTDVEIR